MAASINKRPWYSGNMAADTLYGPPSIRAFLHALPSQPKPTTSSLLASMPAAVYACKPPSAESSLMPKIMLTSGCAVNASAATVTALSFSPEPSTDCAITASGNTDLRPAAKPWERATVVDSAGKPTSSTMAFPPKLSLA